MKAVLVLVFGFLVAVVRADDSNPAINTPDFPITFDHTMVLPQPAVPPREAIYGGAKPQPDGSGALIGFITVDPKDYGPLSALGLGSIASINVTWANPKFFHTESWIQRAMKELLTSPHEGNFTYDTSQQGHLDADLIATINYTSGHQSRWWIWMQQTPCWALQDEKGKWWWGNWDRYGIGGKTFPVPLALRKEPDPSLTVTGELSLLQDNEEANRPSEEILDFLNDQHPRDAEVLAFFREALSTHPNAALHDLTQYPESIWDDSFADPLLKIVETAPTKAVPATGPSPFDTAFTNVLNLLVQHPSVWNDPAVSQRLAKAVVAAYPLLTDPATISNVPLIGSQEFMHAVDLLGDTGDRSSVYILEPYKKYREVAGGYIKHPKTDLLLPSAFHIRHALLKLTDGQPTAVNTATH